MNVLFLTLSDISNLKEHGVYKDLIREFAANGHCVYAVSPMSSNERTHLMTEDGITVLRLKTARNRGVGTKLKKGAAMLLTGRSFCRGIKKYLRNIHFDLVLYATPPITLYHAVRYVKQRDMAVCYLMLKDIFPQNAVDLHMLKKNGLKGIIYRYFKRLEQKNYAIADKIGCMSEANISYLSAHQPQLSRRAVEMLPNSIDVCDYSVSREERLKIRRQYGIPTDKTVLVYGGNLSEPQDVPFIIECLKKEADNPETFYFIAGSGTKYALLQKYIDDYHPAHVKLVSRLSREDYDKMIASCDIGLIFLNHRFTIPNFPSRVLTYMQAHLPVIACTDANTDIGDVIEQNRFGVQCRSNSPDCFSQAVHKMLETGDLCRRGDNAFAYLNREYTVQKAYSVIMESVHEVSINQHRC